MAALRLSETNDSCAPHLWCLANAFSLFLTHPDGSRNDEILCELKKVQRIFEQLDSHEISSDTVRSLFRKGVWLEADLGKLVYVWSDSNSNVRSGNWEFKPNVERSITDNGMSASRGNDCALGDRGDHEDDLSDVVNELLVEFVSQSIIYFTFTELEASWRGTSVSKYQRRMLDLVKESKVQTLGAASRILVGNRVKILTTAVDIQLLQDLMADLDTIPVLSSDFDRAPPTPASARNRRPSIPKKPDLRRILTFEDALKKKDRISNSVLLALADDGIFQQMLREGVRIIIHYHKTGNARIRRVQRMMKLATEIVDTANQIDESDLQTKVINKLEFYCIDVGVVEKCPEHSIVLDDVVEIYNGSFTSVLQNSLDFLHGKSDSDRKFKYERIEHARRCFTLLGCRSPFDDRNCLDVEILPTNKQSMKVMSTNAIIIFPFTFFSQEIHASVLVAHGIAAALQIVRNLNNHNPAFTCLKRANNIIGLYQRYNFASQTISQPMLSIENGLLSSHETVDVLLNSTDVFPNHEIPPENSSVNFLLQRVMEGLEVEDSNDDVEK